MIDCLSASILEALAVPSAGSTHRPAPAALIVALPGPRPGLDPATGEEVERAMKRMPTAVRGSPILVSVGHAAGFVAMEVALERLRAEPDLPVVVAGVDSWLAPDTLEWLEETGQLHSAGERNNAWGFIPGEGAGAILLMSHSQARREAARTLGTVTSVGTGREERLIRSGEVCLGLGLTTAIRAALASLAPGQRVSDVYCDMNGEPYRADEYGFTVTRTREKFESASEFIAPADCWGDVGAASAPLCVALATIAQIKGYARGRTCLAWGGSDSGERGAALLQAQGC
jgi:3-oxoacyl-[acyl-carrier-protein] synthase-1